jgi:hypothetical protein
MPGISKEDTMATREAGHDLFVTSQSGTHANTVLRYDWPTGAPRSVFASGGGLKDPLGMCIGPDSQLYVASSGTNRVLRYDSFSGDFIDTFASGGGLTSPFHPTFGWDQNLYVTSFPNSVLRYNGTTGASGVREGRMPTHQPVAHQG